MKKPNLVEIRQKGGEVSDRRNEELREKSMTEENESKETYMASGGREGPSIKYCTILYCTTERFLR